MPVTDLGETAFHWLVVEDERDAAQWLLEHGSDINTRNIFEQTPLYEAAFLSYLHMCRFLLENGADPGIRNYEGETALSAAATGSKSDPEVVKLLLAQLKDDEDVNAYFDPITVEVLLDMHSPSAELLRERGLIIPNEED